MTSRDGIAHLNWATHRMWTALERDRGFRQDYFSVEIIP